MESYTYFHSWQLYYDKPSGQLIANGSGTFNADAPVTLDELKAMISSNLQSEFNQRGIRRDLNDFKLIVVAFNTIPN